jgi:carboxymethylenebutenolidase
MMKQLFFLTLFFFSTTSFLYPQFTPDTLNNQPETRYHKILIKDGDYKLNCLVFPPPDSAVSAGLIVVHEEWGITDWVISVSSQIAEKGFLVITPDLVSVITSGKDSIQDSDNEEVIRTSLLNAEQGQIEAALDKSYEYLKNNPLCNGRIAITGFSWGGTRVFHYLTENNSLAAGFIFYGRSPENNKELGRIQTPVFGIYGEYDTRINNTLGATIRKMNRLGKEFHTFIIEGGGHGFMRSGERLGATEDNIKARTAGWNKLMELLDQL